MQINLETVLFENSPRQYFIAKHWFNLFAGRLSIMELRKMGSKNNDL